MFSETLKALRLSHGLTQTELAKIIGVNLRTVQNYESGQAVPRNPEVLARLSSYFQIPVRNLITSSDFYRLLRTETQTNLRNEERAELFRILQELTTLFAGGSISAADRELFVRALQDLLQESGTTDAD